MTATHRAVPASDLSSRDAYFMLIDTVVPRPIAWTTTVGRDGVPNLAPFSFFMGVTGSPPTIAVSIAPKVVRHPDGTRDIEVKHTLANLRATGELIVHVAPAPLRDRVVASAAALPRSEGELHDLGFTDVVPGTWVGAPRLAELPVALECRVDRIVPVGHPATHLVLAEVLGWHVREDLFVDGRVPSAGFHPLARLGIESYGTVTPE